MATNEQDILARIAARRAALAEAEQGRGMTASDVQRFETGMGAGSPEDAEVMRGMLASGLRQITFGASDFIGPAVRAVGALVPGGQSPGEAFSEARESVKLGREQFSEEHPVLDAVAGTGGAVVQGFAAAPLLPAKLGIGGATALGATEGALTAFGTTEGDFADRVSAVPGGAAGGGVGGALGLGAGRALGAVAEGGLDFVNLRPTRGIPGLDGVQERAAQRMASTLGDDLGPTRELLESSSRPLALADVDPGAATLARSARSASPTARAEIDGFLGDRVRGQEARILDDALRLTGAGERSSVFETTQQVIQRRSEQAKPLYDAAYEHSVPREVVGDVLDDPVFQDAYNRGVRIAKREGVDLPALDSEADGIPVQAIDYMKRGLDDTIDVGSRSSTGMGRQEARGLRGQLRSMLERVDEAVPEYAEARAAFAGESALLDALEQGSDLWKLDPAEARSIMEALPDSEKEMFVRGGLEAMAARIEDASSTFDITKRRPLADRTRDLDRLRLLFPDDDAFAEFQRGVADEARIAATQRFAVGGSQTFDKAAAFADLRGRGPRQRRIADVGRRAQHTLETRQQGCGRS